MSDPANRVILIRRSLSAFGFGLIGLIPLLGLIPAVYAVFCWLRLRRRYRDEWNPAAAYLNWGAVFGIVGISVLLLAVLALVLAIVWGDVSLSDSVPAEDS